MTNTLISRSKLQRLIGAATHLQSLMNDGTLTAAWGEGDADQINAAVTAFDTLTNAAALAAAEQKTASPFLRYRREIVAETPTGAALRLLVLNLYSEAQAVCLRTILAACDPLGIRIALECIVSFAEEGDRDSQFMGLAMEIAEFIGDDDYRREVAE